MKLYCNFNANKKAIYGMESVFVVVKSSRIPAENVF
jgi:hypothetical protein